MVYFPSGVRWFDALVFGAVVTAFAILAFLLSLGGGSSPQGALVTGLALLVGLSLLCLGLVGGWRAGWKPAGPR